MDKDKLDLIAQTIFDKKGFNIFVLDVRETTALTDYFILAEGTVSRHVKAIGQAIKHAMEEIDYKILCQEGSEFADWIVLDYGDIIIHLFTPGFREKYGLESVWKEGKIVDVHIDTSQFNTGS